MPEVIYYLAIFSQLILPVVIIIGSIYTMIVAKDAYLCYPILTFQCIVQAGIFGTYLLDWHKAFRKEYEDLAK